MGRVNILSHVIYSLLLSCILPQLLNFNSVQEFYKHSVKMFLNIPFLIPVSLMHE
jgi:hypothetical protein